METSIVNPLRTGFWIDISLPVPATDLCLSPDVTPPLNSEEIVGVPWETRKGLLLTSGARAILMMSVSYHLGRNRSMEVNLGGSGSVPHLSQKRQIIVLPPGCFPPPATLLPWPNWWCLIDLAKPFLMQTGTKSGTSCRYVSGYHQWL